MGMDFLTRTAHQLKAATVLDQAQSRIFNSLIKIYYVLLSRNWSRYLGNPITSSMTFDTQSLEVVVDRNECVESRFAGERHVETIGDAVIFSALTLMVQSVLSSSILTKSSNPPHSGSKDSRTCSAILITKTGVRIGTIIRE